MQGRIVLSYLCRRVRADLPSGVVKHMSSCRQQHIEYFGSGIYILMWVLKHCGFIFYTRPEISLLEDAPEVFMRGYIAARLLMSLHCHFRDEARDYWLDNRTGAT
jgi:hypothetical protein